MFQKNMVRVLYALVPVTFAAIYLFGWRTLLIVTVTSAAGFLTEWFMQSKKNGKVSLACFVSTTLLALSLPPSIPLWIPAVGAVVAIFFAKEAFGGFGKNPFNPAIVGRAFVYVSFPVEMASQFSPAYGSFPGGLIKWSASGGSDALTAATPLFAAKNLSVNTPIYELFTGAIGGNLAAGSMGEASAIAIIIGAAYLFITKTAKWQLTLSTLLGAAVFSFFMGSISFNILAGGLLFASVFMVTDPVSAPKTALSQWIYGFLIGALIILFRFKSSFAGGVAFAVLIGNIAGPSLDSWIIRYRARKNA